VKRLALGTGLAILIAGLFRRHLNRLIGSIRSRTDGLDRLTKEELYQRAQEADIQGRSEMSKDELVRALQRNGSRGRELHEERIGHEGQPGPR